MFRSAFYGAVECRPDQSSPRRSVLGGVEFPWGLLKADREYEALDPSRKSIRVQVGYQGRDFRFIFTGEKWLNELLPADHPQRGGGGTIDFVRHLTGQGFVHAVKVCLDAAEELGSR